MAALSPTSPPSSSNRIIQRTPKLHLSCDGCAASKVKCDKKRPTCDRCADNGTTCVYSPSRKFGKPSKKRFLAQQAALLPANSQNLNGRGPSPNVLTSNSSDRDSYLTAWGEYILDQQLPPFPDLDDKFQFQLPDFATFDPSIITGSALVHQEPSQLDHDQTSLDQARISTPSSDFNPQSPSGVGWIDNHCCQDTAYAALATLHCRTKEPFISRNGDSANASALPSPLADFPSSSPPNRPTMDKVLSTNKAVLNTLIGLLDCQCAKDPHLAMLYASILFKVLIWYQVASGIRPSSKSTSSPPSMSRSTGTLTDNGTSISTPSNFQSKGVLPTQIQVGGHILDEEDQLMLQRDLLLREVRKVGNVIDQMAASNDPEETGAASWYAVASRILRLELQMTINKIKSMEVPSGQS